MLVRSPDANFGKAIIIGISLGGVTAITETGEGVPERNGSHNLVEPEKPFRMFGFSKQRRIPASTGLQELAGPDEGPSESRGLFLLSH